MNTILETIALLARIDHEVEKKTGIRVTTHIAIEESHYKYPDSAFDIYTNNLLITTTHNYDEVVRTKSILLPDAYSDNDIIQDLISYIGELVAANYDKKDEEL